jgi:hypothetical protein
MGLFISRPENCQYVSRFFLPDAYPRSFQVSFSARQAAIPPDVKPDTWPYHCWYRLHQKRSPVAILSQGDC